MTKRAIVKVLWGKGGGRKVVVPSGSGIRVGRGEDVELSLPNDRELSNHHFSVDYNGEHIRVRDIGSIGGTWALGRRWTSGAVDSGTVVKAGETVFRVFIEAASQRASPDLDPARLEKAARALPILKREQEAQPLFGVFDAARDPRIVVLTDESIDDVWSLYEGIDGDALADVAPYLVRFSSDSELLDRMVMEGWARAWGVFFSASRPAKDIRRHLRRFLMVEPDDAKERMYFRYYDPRVLRDFLPIATPRQKSEFFGDISWFLLEAADGELVRVDPFEAPATDAPPATFEDEETIGQDDTATGGPHVPHP
jgi:hypothetical protein